MDPFSALLVATVMMLLNGGVLGLMHRSLTRDIQPSAADWRIGTLLVAGASALLADQGVQFTPYVLPVINGCLFMGMTLYWRALRRFDGLADSYWLFVPALLAALGIFWFSALMPNQSVRVVIASLAWALPLFYAAYTLWHGERRNTVLPGSDRPGAISRFVLAGILMLEGSFMVFRAVYVSIEMSNASAVIDPAHWLNIAMPLVVAILPIIGTTVFLTMCLERIRDQWTDAAATDYLTGLPNRRTITSNGESRFNAAQRSSADFAVAILDVDHFKRVNDRYGHDAGDLALKHIAHLLNTHCRGPNLAGRQGGEEFVVLLENIAAHDAKNVADRLRSVIETAPLAIKNEMLHITVSIGLRSMTENDQSFDDMLTHADQALYRAKQAGRNQVVVADA